MRVDGLRDLRVFDAGDVEMPPATSSGRCAACRRRSYAVAATGAIPVVLGGDHSIALADATGVAQHHGHGRVSVVHFDAHADTGDIEFGSLYGHGQPMRRLIESGAARGDRFLQIGLRGYWPGPETLDWMAAQGMRSYEMSEIGRPRARRVPRRGVRDRARRLRRCVPVGRHRRGRPGARARHRHAGAGRPDRSAAARRGAPGRLELPVVGVDVVEVSPPYDHADITAALANRVVLEALSGIAARRGGIDFDPRRPLLADRPEREE